jgi:Stage III sporulation protein AE (spore_III_AE).
MMKNKRGLIFCVFLLLIFLPICANAEEEDLRQGIVKNSGAERIYDILDEDSKDLLSGVGIDGAWFDVENAEKQNYLQMLSAVLNEKIHAPMKAAAMIFLIIILCKIFSSFENSEVRKVSDMAAILCVGAVLLPPAINLIDYSRGVAQGTSVFLLTSGPIYGALLAATGRLKSAASLAGMTIAVGNAVPVLLSGVIIPMLNMFLGLAVTASVSTVPIKRATDGIYSFAKWSLSILITIFFAVVAIQSTINHSMDEVSVKTVKFVTSSAIPVIGGTISDSLSMIQGSVQVIRSGIGAFGILAAIAIFLPLFAEAVVWIVVCFTGETVAELFEMPQIAAFLAQVMNVIKMILAAMVSLFAVCVVCTSMVILMGVSG